MRKKEPKRANISENQLGMLSHLLMEDMVILLKYMLAIYIKSEEYERCIPIRELMTDEKFEDYVFRMNIIVSIWDSQFSDVLEIIYDKSKANES